MLVNVVYTDAYNHNDRLWSEGLPNGTFINHNYNIRS